MQIPRLMEGKTALITGAGQGHGRAMAIGLAQASARVIVTDLNQATAQETAQLIEQSGGQAQAHALDVGDALACQALLALTAFAATAGPLPELDVTQGMRPSEATRTRAARTRANAAVLRLASPKSMDERYDVPNML